MKKSILFAALVSFLFACNREKSMYETVIPKPLHVKLFRGEYNFNDHIVICTSPDLNGSQGVARYLSGEFKKVLNWNISIDSTRQHAKTNFILLTRIHSKNELGQEGYILDVNSDSIVIKANSPNGLFYGVQTFIQSILPYKNNLIARQPLIMPCAEVIDSPNFNWRGMHFDVSRHFFKKEFIKQYIDVLALHKMNVFHWHLTDDQGWRIEIKKYPKLTELGAWREGTAKDFDFEIKAVTDPSKPKYGGFYTQDDIREIIRYAQERFITIIPEIEMPGHSWFALYAYPELSCSGKPWKKPDTVAFEFSDPYCAGNEKTFEFMDDVLTEVINLFPSKYIHIGGDECKKTPWAKCPKCQKRMTDEGLIKVEELQSYFIKRVEKIVNSKGRQVIGWDEILEGGLAPGAAVMSWRGEEGGIAAAKEKHTVVMAPSPYLYFDAYQDDRSIETPSMSRVTPIDTVYMYNPVPKSLSAEERKYIIGAEACLWAEQVPNDSNAMIKLLPRLAALSEINWLPENKKNLRDFKERLMTQFIRYDAMNWPYYINAPGGLGNNVFYKDHETFAITSTLPAEIRFTTDGTEPALNSPLYSKPISISEKTIIKAKTFLPGGKSSITRTGEYRKDILRKAVDVSNPSSGLSIKTFKGCIKTLNNFDSLKFVSEGTAETITIPDTLKDKDFYALEFNGYIKIKKEDLYTFFTQSDDGTRLFIDDEMLIDNDGVHGFMEKQGQIPLAKGYHKLTVLYFEGNYGEQIKVSMKTSDSDKQELSKDILYH